MQLLCLKRTKLKKEPSLSASWTGKIVVAFIATILFADYRAIARLAKLLCIYCHNAAMITTMIH